MPRLDWKRQEEGWKAGRYYVEEIAPGTWTCSRMRSGVPTVEMVATSPRRLQEGMDKTERKIRSTRRALVYLIAFAAFAVLALRSANWDARAAAAVTLLASALATFCFIGIIEAWVSRTWEPPPRTPYR